MRWLPILLVGFGLAGAGEARAEWIPSLRGSPASMQQQNRVAKEHQLPFYRTVADIRRAAEAGELVRLTGDENYEVADFVPHPYLHPATALFVTRLAAQYREACGQKLVVTSAVRPLNGQPSNSHALSVHPAGMAVDLRVSDRASCRAWLESSLLSLERSGVINGIREFRPPHYHIAVFPNQYLAYAEERMAREGEVQLAQRLEVEAGEGVSALLTAGEPPRVEADEDGPAGGSRQIALALMVVCLPFGIGYLLRRRR